MTLSDYIADASSLAKLFLEDEGYPALRTWFKQAVRGGGTIWAPELVRYEIGNVVQREYAMEPVEVRAEIVDDVLAHLRIEPADVMATFEAVGELTYYDAAYLALALENDAVLVSRDTKLLAQADALGVETKRL